MKDERLYLSNIQECIQRIQEYTRGGREDFIQTPIIQDAVIRNFEIIGEATKRLSIAFIVILLILTILKFFVKN